MNYYRKPALTNVQIMPSNTVNNIFSNDFLQVRPRSALENI